MAGPPRPDLKPSPGEEEEFIIEDGEGAGKQQRFLKQCFLVDQIIPIAKKSKARNSRFENFSLVTGELPKINGRLLGRSSPENLFKFTEKQIAGLYPEVRLFKAKVKSKKITDWVEIPFAKNIIFDRDFAFHGTVDEETDPLGDVGYFSGFGGSAGGIKSFSYELAGTNPEEAQRVISAKLRLWFQSLNDLFFRAQDGAPSPVDLIEYTDGRGSKASHLEYDFKKFKFKVVVGWAFSENSVVQGSNLYTDADIEALKRNKLALYLQLVNHELSIKQDGTVELDIEYIAAPEAEFNRPLLNVLWTPEDARVEALHELMRNIKANRTKVVDLKKKLNKIKSHLSKPSVRRRIATNTGGSKYVRSQEDIIEDNIIEEIYRALTGLKPDTEVVKEHYWPGTDDLVGVTRRVDYDVAVLIEKMTPSLKNYKPNQPIAGTLRLLQDHILDELQHNAERGRGHPMYADKDVDVDELVDYINTDLENIDIAIAAAGENLKDQAAKLRKRAQVRRMARYNTMMDLLYDDGRVRIIQVNPTSIGTSAEGVLTTEAAIEDMNTYNETPQEGRSSIDKSALTKKWYGKAKAQRENSDLGDSDDVVGGDDIDAGWEPGTELDSSGTRPQGTDPSKIPIYFVTFGDIMDIAIAICRDDPSVKGEKIFENHGILSGPITVIYKETVPDYNAPGGKKDVLKKYILNMAHVPISLEYFQLWYQQNVVIQQLETYPLKSFILDVANDLIRKALGEGCLDGVDINDIDVKTNYVEQAYQNVGLRRGKCTLQALRQFTADGKLPKSPYKSAEDIVHFLYIYSLEKDPAFDESKRSKNFEDGIYHFEVGAREGLVKDITFAKQDIPGLREARITGDTDNKEGFLREKYDINVSMVGNTLFYPGQYVYLNPRLPGASRKQAQNLGLGGLHFVHEVFHLVEDRYYQTEIKAIWQAFASEEGTAILETDVLQEHDAVTESAVEEECKGPSIHLGAKAANISDELKKFEGAATAAPAAAAPSPSAPGPARGVEVLLNLGLGGPSSGGGTGGSSGGTP